SGYVPRNSGSELGVIFEFHRPCYRLQPPTQATGPPNSKLPMDCLAAGLKQRIRDNFLNISAEMLERLWEKMDNRLDYTVGRGKSNYGTVLSLLVSRLHCVFRATENGLVIKDLNSSNGTFVNDQKIPANTDCILKVSDVIGIGVSNPKAADHFVFKLVNEDCEDSNNIVCHSVKNEPSTERKSSRTEKSPCILTVEEEEDENDEPLIIEQEIDVIDLIEDDDNKTTAGSTIKSASSCLASCTNSGTSSSLEVENRKTICIKKEKLHTDVEGSAQCVNGGKRNDPRSVACDVINLRENEGRFKDIKIESGVETRTVVEACNLQPSGLNSVCDNQCVVKVEKPASSSVNTENNRVENVCGSCEVNISFTDLQRKNLPEIKIKEEDINTHSTSNSCKNITYCDKEKQTSCFDTPSRTKCVPEIGTSSKNVIIANVKQENTEKCKNSELSENVSENITLKDNSSVQKGNTCVLSSRVESSQKLASKRTHEESVQSLPDDSAESPRPASKKRKSSIVKDGSSESNSGSSTNSASERCDSSSRLHLDVESDNEDMWFNTFAVPILDQLEKTDARKSVGKDPVDGINSKRALAKNGTFTNVNTKRTRNAGTFILSEMRTLPAYLNPVIILEKLDLKKLQETRHDIKQERDISFDEALFEESLQLHTSTPKQGDLPQINENCHTTENHNTSIINYSQSDDVIVIDDDDDFMDVGKDNKSVIQKDEDSEDGKEEICVKQEVFEEDEQVIEDEEDDDEVELVNDWVLRLSQSSSPVIEDEIRPSSSGKLKRRSLFILDSDSSDEDYTSNLAANIAVGGDIVNQNPDLNSDKCSKIIFDDFLKNRSNELSLKSKELVNNSIKEQTRIRNKTIDQCSEMSLTDKTNEDLQSENESDLSPLSAYADKLLESALPACGKKPSKKTSNSAEGSITKELHENAKSNVGDSSRRTLLCSALPMKLKSRSKVTAESRDPKKASGFNSDVAKHCPVNEFRNTDLLQSKKSSSECKSKSSVHKNVDNSPVSEKELKMKVKEDRKAKLKALTDQKRSATTSNTETKESSKSSNKSHHQNVVKNTTLSRADKLTESLVGSLEAKPSKSKKIKVRVIKKNNSGQSSACDNTIPGENSSYCKKSSVINTITSEVAAPKQTAGEETAPKQSESNGDKLDLDIPVSEVEIKIKKLSFKDVYKIPKLKQSNSSETQAEDREKRTKELQTATKKHLNKPSALRNIALSYPKKTVRFAPGESLCEVQTFMIEPGNVLRRIDGKDIPVRKRMAEQAGILYDTSTKILNRVTTAILRHWNPRWMAEQAVILRNGGEPPPAHCQNTPVSTLCPMLTAFSNYEEYLKIIDPLMMLDLWAKVSEDSNKPNPRMKRKYDITVLESKDANGIVTLNCSMPLKSKEEKEGLSLHVGDLCILRYPMWNHSTGDLRHNMVASQQESYYERFAYIHSLTKDFRSTNNQNRWNTPGNARQISPIYGVMNLVIKVKGDSSLKLINASLRIISGIRTELRHFEAIGYLEHTKLCNMILNPRVEDFKIPCSDPNVKIVTEDLLNAAQRTAVMKGTGKTQVILNIIKQVLYPNGHYSKARFDKKTRILLCAPSNAAADEMAERLLNLRTQMPKEKRFKMVRTGPLEYMRESVRGISLDELTKKEVEHVLPQQTQFESVELEKHVPGPKISEIEREAKKKVLFHADIVVTTLTSSYSPQITEVFASRNGRNNIRFACCIIDEATQCTEPESLIPLMLGIERLVLVGDPEQLPATVLSQVAKTKSFGQSLFNRIWNKFQNEANNPIIFLNTQYRMHPEIYHWPNTYIYHGRVMTDPSCQVVCPLKPYCLFAHRFQQNSHNFVNSNEARLVLEIAMGVAHSFHEHVKTIGIITPYQQQLQEIKTCLDRSRTNNVTVVVNTIDGFQGRECDVIIFSCVRTRGVGFMGESQRLNVALTRARRSLIICGNFVSLQDSDVHRQMYILSVKIFPLN
ncbi:Regulator of nonsense transcripts 1 homolog, partial [Gryllus bimaculatus]